MKTSALPIRPPHPDRVCWGCDKYCPETDLACGNGTIRTPHPIELFGDDWVQWFDRPPIGDGDPAAAASHGGRATKEW